MMKKKVILVFLCLILIIISGVVYNSNIKTDNILIDNVDLKDLNLTNGDSIAIMIEKADESGYEKSSSYTFPTDGYRLNKVKTGCNDSKGNALNNAITYSNNKISIKSSGSAYCYLYFDVYHPLSELCNNGEELGSCMIDHNDDIDSLNDNVEGGLYRYQGTNEVVEDNYICFGTDNKNECINNTDAYMYRIIGIDNNGQIKLIKKEALNEVYSWHNSRSSDISWIESDLFKGLNGITGGNYSNLFIGNSTYMPSGWSEKIVNYNWKYGKTENEKITATELFSIENSWTSKVEAKIGLMYLHDYAYGLSGGNNCSSSGAYDICKTSWIFFENNDLEVPGIYEWTMSYYGNYDNVDYRAWTISKFSYYILQGLTDFYTIRPVFYLNADEVYVSGNGTINDPIMLSEPEITTIGEYLVENKPTGLNTTTVYGNMYRFIGPTAYNYVKLDNQMFRIIGVTAGTDSYIEVEPYQVKLMSDDPVIEDYYSNIQNYLWNNNGVPSSWLNRIDSVRSYTGSIDDGYEGADGDYLRYLEMNGTDPDPNSQEPRKVNLIYPSDLAYSKSSTSSSSTWMTHRSWSLTPLHWYDGEESTYDNQCIIAYGNITCFDVIADSDKFPGHSVFYLNKDVYYKSGSGTSGDPFILE